MFEDFSAHIRENRDKILEMLQLELNAIIHETGLSFFGVATVQYI